LSVQAPPEGVGTYDESVTLSLGSDMPTAQIAAWRVHLGTWDEARWPVVNLDLRAAPHLRQAVLDSLDIRTVITIANPPGRVPPGPVRLVVQGYRESIEQGDWRLSLNCSPAGPWSVAVTGEARADTDIIFDLAGRLGFDPPELVEQPGADHHVVGRPGHPDDQAVGYVSNPISRRTSALFDRHASVSP
jgi:hypothetical protein